eukprot:GHVR01100176.1.p1 GENE.GHVR01100176.1~~GHVR01100176.1.p1  ORF type:complete len:125 (+),score=12.19 GHVR01100176.1:252-626(+)
MEREVKHVTLNMVMTDGYSRIGVKAYTTKIAGVVVAPRHDYVIKGGNPRIVRRQQDWCIWTYPVGLRLLSGIPSRVQAIEFAEANLHKYQWVALLKEDILKNNDMESMLKDFVEYRRQIVAMKP